MTAAGIGTCRPWHSIGCQSFCAVIAKNSTHKFWRKCMKQIFFVAMLLAAWNLFAADAGGEQWHSTTLSDATIKNIQDAKYRYLHCISKETEKRLDSKMDSRAATDLILKQCEQPLTNIRQVFKQEKVPDGIADLYLKKTRTQTARKVLEQMMYSAASR